MISFSGVDGSGKSTLADRTLEYLQKKGVKAAKLEVYAGSTFLGIGRGLGRISGKIKDDLETKISGTGRKTGALFSTVRIFCFCIDIVRLRIRSRILNAGGILPVCDRHLYDILIHLRYLKAIGDRLYRILLRLIPRPEVPVLLFLDGASAMEREKQHDDIGYYLKKIRLYEKLAGEAGLIKVSSLDDRDAVWKKVENIIESKII